MGDSRRRGGWHVRPPTSAEDDIDAEDIQGILAAEGFSAEEFRELRCATHRPERFAFALDRTWVAKIFGPDDFRNFLIEEKVSRILHARGISVPEVIAARAQEGTYSYIVFRHAAGESLSSVYQTMSLTEYTSMVVCLAEVFKGIHNLAPTLFDGIPFFERDHEQYFNLSSRRSTTIHDSVRALIEEGALHASACQICEVVEREATGMFRSEKALIHADIHNENLFLGGTERSLFCEFIDWETARIEPFELEFVHPFLNILGEAFPGRRLGNEVQVGPDNELLKAFDNAYDQLIRWDHVAIHGVVTYLDWALRAHRKKQFLLRDFYLRTGIGGLEFVGLLRMEGLISDA